MLSWSVHCDHYMLESCKHELFTNYLYTISISKWYVNKYFFLNASEDLRLTTSHETKGKTDLKREDCHSLIICFISPLLLCIAVTK